MDGNAGTVEGGGIMKQTYEDDLTKAYVALAVRMEKDAAMRIMKT